LLGAAAGRALPPEIATRPGHRSGCRVFAQTVGNKKIEEEEREVKAEWINMKKNSTDGKKRRTLWYFHFFCLL
jgi:hypothetical protein